MKRGIRARAIGDTWESRAAAFLQDNGVRILARGYSCRLGELDIVGTDGRHLVVVEVKARAGCGTAMHAVGPDKRRRIINATRHFLMRNPDWFSKPIRFDVIGIEAIESKNPEFLWVKNAFDAA